jgi:hypothetical protein
MSNYQEAFERYDCDERDGTAPLRGDKMIFNGEIEYYECQYCHKLLIIGAGPYCSWCGKKNI